jgi:polar amino acid transport system substrate-binding protein
MHNQILTEEQMVNKNHFGSQAFVVLIVLTLVLSVPQFIFPVPDAGAGGSGLAKIKKAGKLVVGTSADYPPYEFRLLNEQDDELVGIDIDIARAIAKELGVELEIKDLIFSRIFDALKSGQIDIAIAGLHPTDERKKVADFSIIYYQAIQSVLIRKDNADIIKSIVDLRGKRVAAQTDSIQADMARTQIEGAEFVARETIEELIILLKKRLVHALILEEPVATSYANQYKTLMTIKCEKLSNEMGSAIAVKKGSKALLTEINRILKKLIAENKIPEFVENAKMLSDKR